MKKILFISILAVFSQLLFVQSPAQASWFEFFFPSLRTPPPDPTDTLEAPFADPNAIAESKVSKGQLPENALPLELPHRTEKIIVDWLVTALSNSLTFSAGRYEAQFNDNAAFFSSSGVPEYSAFLGQYEMTRAVQSRQYQLRSFVNGAPLLLNEGAVSGSYKWLYEVPVLVSYLDPNLTDYKTSKEPINRSFTLKIQIGRAANAENDHGILIDHWDGKLDKAKR